MQHFLIKLLVGVNVLVLNGDFLVGEEHEVVNEDFSSLFQRVFGADGAVRRYVNDKLVVVGLLLDTIWLNRITYVSDWGVNGIDRNYIHIGAELTILVGGHIASAFVNGEINLQ